MSALSIHNIVDRSEANGPGVRTVFWVQGCDLGCKGCANTETHDTDPGVLMTTADLIKEIPPDVGGVTISGGEPFQQNLESLYQFVWICKKMGLSVVVFSGYSERELNKMKSPQSKHPGREWLRLLLEEGWIDLVVAGRYVQKLKVNEIPLLSTSNQKLMFLSDRYTQEDVLETGFGEYIFDFETGTQIKTGVI